MASSQNPNLEILTLTVHLLGDLADDMVFLGGCATGLLISDPAAPPIRAIRVVSPPYFLITKLEAFTGRGKGDYMLSHDMEDIITVLDGRQEILDEIKNADTELASELANRFQQLLKHQRFIDAVSGHMPTHATSQARVTGIIETINRIANQ